MWKGEHSFECLELEKTNSLIEAKGIVSGGFPENFFTSEYQLRLTRNWRVEKVQLRYNLGKNTLHLSSDQKGDWFDGNGTRIPYLNGCIDIDISITPFTNSSLFVALKENWITSRI